MTTDGEYIARLWQAATAERLPAEPEKVFADDDPVIRSLAAMPRHILDLAADHAMDETPCRELDLSAWLRMAEELRESFMKHPVYREVVEQAAMVPEHLREDWIIERFHEHATANAPTYVSGAIDRSRVCGACDRPFDQAGRCGCS